MFVGGRRLVATFGVVALGTLTGLSGERAELPASSLRVRARDGGWVEWWRSDRAPAAWGAEGTAGAAARLAPLVSWRAVRPGVDHGELTISGDGEAVRTRVVLVRVDPRAVRLSLQLALNAEGAPRWRAGDVSSAVIAAVNAGQFVDRLPWGLLVLDGARIFPAGSGPLVTTVAVDSAGAVALTHAGAATGSPRWAFQSYPTLLAGGSVLEALRREGRGVDVRHRDGRVALGLLGDGRVLLAMTRFDALGKRLGFVPFGLTTPEMAAVMGALGARDAVMLDGGTSAQMIVRERDGRARVWPGVRPVPLGLVVE